MSLSLSTLRTSFSLCDTIRSSSTATKWTLRWDCFDSCRFQGQKWAKLLDECNLHIVKKFINTSSVKKWRLRVNLLYLPHCFTAAWTESGDVLSAAPGVASALVFGIQKRCGAWPGWGGVLWPCISIPGAHSAKPPPLLWDHRLAGRCSRLLNVPLAMRSPPSLLPSSSCNPFASVQTRIPATFFVMTCQLRLLWRSKMAWRGWGKLLVVHGEMTTNRMWCFYAPPVVCLV